MVTTNDPEIASVARACRSHGMTSGSWDRHTGRTGQYDVKWLGYNYRPTEVTSALGRVQLRKLDACNEKRRERVARYCEAFASAEGMRIPLTAYEGESAHHIFPIVVQAPERRDLLRSYLESCGVQTSVHYRPVHQLKYHSDFFSETTPDSLAITEEYGIRELTLPLFSTMTDKQQRTVVQSVGGGLRELSQ